MPPLSILVKPASGNCQYRCRYCFYADVMANRAIPNFGMMSMDTLEKLIRGALAYGEGDVTFGFQGGEPTLCGLEFFENVIKFEHKYRREARVHNSIQTNGGLINAQWAEFFARNNFLVGLSIDGARDTHNLNRVDARGEGTHARALQAAETLASAGAQFNILCVVTNELAKHPEAAYQALKPYKYIQFIPCIDDFERDARRFSPDADTYARFLVDTYKLYARDFRNGEYVSVRNFDNYLQMILGARPESCGMSGRCACYFVVEANGDAYPCDFYVLDKWKLGNIHSDALADMARSASAKAFVTESVHMSPECRACRWYYLCRGGCRRDREPFDAAGKPRLNKYCASYIALFDACHSDMRALAESARNRRE